MFQNQKSF